MPLYYRNTYQYFQHLSKSVTITNRKRFFPISCTIFLCMFRILDWKKIFEATSRARYHYPKYIFRLLIPLIIFENINNLLEIIKQLLRQTPKLTICHDILKHILFYPYGALWYVQASIIAIIIIYPFLKKGRIQIILIISIFLYAFALLCNNYYFLIENSYLQIIVDSYMQLFISARNGIFVGTCFLILGIYVGVHIESPKLYQYTKPLLFISTILYFLELLLVNQHVPLDDGALFISHLFIAPLLLIILTKSSLHLKHAKYLRNLSTGMYFLHRILIAVIDILSFVTRKILPVTALFFIVILMSILICTYSYTLKNRFFNQLLR